MEERFPVTAQRMAGRLTAAGLQARAEGIPALVPTPPGLAPFPPVAHPTPNPGTSATRSLQRREGTGIRRRGTWPQQDPWHLQVRALGWGVPRAEEGSGRWWGKAQSEKELSQTEGVLPGSQPLLSPSLQSRRSRCPGGRAPAGTAPCLGLPEMPSAVPLLSCPVPPRPCTPAAQSRARRGIPRGAGQLRRLLVRADPEAWGGGSSHGVLGLY